MATQPSAYQPHPLLPSDSRVIVFVSSGPYPQAPRSFAEVPDVVGKNQGKALAAFQEAGLSTKVVNDYSDVYKSGEVIGQLPPRLGNMPVGSEAVLLVSSGPAPTQRANVPLPDVMGKTEAEALAMLHSAGLSPQVVYEHSTSVPAGIVMAQMPNRESLAEGQERSKNLLPWIIGGIAVLLVLVGALFFMMRPADKVEVPDVIGMEQEEAVETIERAGLIAKIVVRPSDEGEPGTVIKETPEPGEVVDEGSEVEIEVPAEEELVSVPNVVGADQAEATRLLERAGFGISVRRENHLTVERGLVISQSPAAGQEAPEGSEVGVVISNGPSQQNVRVPDVVGLTSADARDSLVEAGLKVVVAESSSDTVANDVVITQLPAAGDSVAPGTSVGIVVSTGPADNADKEAVPDVVGLTLAEAQQVITDAGFEAIAVPAIGSGKPANEVVAQTPEAGEEVKTGSTIALYYSAGG